MKEKLLYLCHRIPYPPNKGDKIAAFNLLKFLSEHYDVYLGCFIDDPNDQQFKEYVSKHCKEACFINLNPSFAKLKGLTAFYRNEPITLPYYKSNKLKQWVHEVVSHKGVRKAVLFSSCMAQYVTDRYSDLHSVMHFVDIDSDKWKQYAEKQQGIMRYVYWREHRMLERYEKEIANKLQVSCFVTEAETEMFKELVGSPVDKKVHTLSNGIDTNYFSPSANAIELQEAYELQSQNYIVFTGAMDYWANIDAVIWFVNRVWPQVKAEVPDSLFYIVGSSPDRRVLELQNTPGIIVTGRVHDVRPYIKNAKACVAPMQIARGIQNKILEALAMAKPVAASYLGMEGIEGTEEIRKEHLLISDDSSEITRWTVSHLSGPAQHSNNSRTWMQNHYSWAARLKPVLQYLEQNRD